MGLDLRSHLGTDDDGASSFGGTLPAAVPPVPLDAPVPDAPAPVNVGLADHGAANFSDTPGTPLTRPALPDQAAKGQAVAALAKTGAGGAAVSALASGGKAGGGAKSVRTPNPGTDTGA